jgi:hypothetical protein
MKNAKIQLMEQVKYIREYHGHVLSKEWKIATVIAYKELQFGNTCQNCIDFLLGPVEFENLKGWWENIGTKLESHRQFATAQSSLRTENKKNCYKKLVGRIIGFSSSCFKSTIKSVRNEVSTTLKGNSDLVSAGPSKELTMSAAKPKKGHTYPRTQDKLGDQRIKLFLSENQRALLLRNDCKLLLLNGTYGSGKSLLLRLKALELAARGEKVAFLVGGGGFSRKFYALTKQDFQNTKVKFLEKPSNENYCLSDIFKMHHNSYHIFWDECIITADNSMVKMKLDTTKGYFWIAASKYQSIKMLGDRIDHFNCTMKKVNLKVCFRNSPAIQQFEKIFFSKTMEEIKKNPPQQSIGDLPGKDI